MIEETSRKNWMRVICIILNDVSYLSGNTKSIGNFVEILLKHDEKSNIFSTRFPQS